MESFSEQAEIFRGQMLTEMARMSCEDGLIMQITLAQSEITLKKFLTISVWIKALIFQDARTTLHLSHFWMNLV